MNTISNTTNLLHSGYHFIQDNLIPSSFLGQSILLTGAVLTTALGITGVAMCAIGKSVGRSTDLVYACDHYELAEIKNILHQKPETLNAKDEDGSTPLIAACDALKSDVVKFLLNQKGIEVNQRNSDGQTALMYASARENIESVKLLLAHKDINPLLKDHSGWSALKYAFVNKQDEILQLLLDHLHLSKVDIDFETSDFYQTNSSLSLSAKSFIHLTLLPVHALYVIVKNIIYIAIDLGKTALRTFEEFPFNFMKYGFLSASIYFTESFVYNSTRSLTLSLWKIVRVPLYTSGMLLASIYGIISTTNGRTQLNNIACSWKELTLLKITGLVRIHSLCR